MTSGRLYAAGPIAAMATAGLFMVMEGLVGSDGEVMIDPRAKPRIIEWQEPPEVVMPDEKKWDVEPPELVIIEDEMEPIEIKHEGPDRSGIKIPKRPSHIIDGPTGPDFGAMSDGDYLPVVRVQPTYPQRALERGIEGYAVVELTVASDGSVPKETIRIVAAEPAGYFEREALKAAAKFKYKPKVVNGQAQTVNGVRYQFSFNMSQ